MKELTDMQIELNVPKNQYNDFGKYHYRSYEDIIEKLKPILKQHNCTLYVTDDLEVKGERYYVKATARLTNAEGEVLETTGWAREDPTKKGMDGSQITGSASSYARKVAVGGMFNIDNAQEADAYQQTDQNAQQPSGKQDPRCAELRERIQSLGKQKGYSPAEIAATCHIDNSSSYEALDFAMKSVESWPERQAN